MSSITEFYENQQILITGGTGFVGKLLINKLLLSCFQVGKIILLLRKKENECVNDRMKHLFADEIFDSLKSKYPSYSEKVELVEGDCEKIDLGLSNSDRVMLTARTTVIFHCAANVQFDLDIATEVRINVTGALAIVKLAQLTTNLKALVYVSSAYSNCHLPIVEEKYYKPSISYKTLMKLTKTKFLNENEKSILGCSKSTYFFSKAIAEAVIFEEGKQLPVAIFRPSAIISTWKEPIPGWTNKAFAPTFLVKLIALGGISSIHCNSTAIVDMVPADLTINALIAVGWDVHHRYVNYEFYEPRIYNYTSMLDNPLPFERFLIKCFGIVRQKPPLQAVWYPTLSVHKSKFVNNIRSLTRSWLLTAFVCLFGSSKWRYRMVRSAAFYTVLMRLLAGIMEQPHIYTNDNVKKLWSDMSADDRRMYFFDMKQFDWDNFLTSYYDGILRFVLKEQDRDEKVVRRRTMVLRIIHVATKVTVCIFGFVLLRALMFGFAF